MNAASDPYFSSKKARLTGPWYDHFFKSGENVWIVFWGQELLAEVKNEQQAKNVVAKLTVLEVLVDPLMMTV